jgi:hypothetical protein
MIKSEQRETRGLLLRMVELWVDGEDEVGGTEECRSFEVEDVDVLRRFDDDEAERAPRESGLKFALSSAARKAAARELLAMASRGCRCDDENCAFELLGEEF